MADQRTRAASGKAETEAQTDDQTPARAVRSAVEEAGEASEGKADEIPTFSVERLVNEAEAFFGTPKFIVAGALSAVKTKNLSVAEGKAAIKAFLATEVK